MMRAAITCPIPGTVVSSFSVAVLMSILPSGVFCFECDPFGLGVARLGIDGLGFAVEGKVRGVGNAGWRAFVEIAKRLNKDGLAGRTSNRPMLMPQAPIFSWRASFSNC